MKRDHDYAQNFIEDHRELALGICDWFYDHARSLPWREDPSPYHIWISEIMLQQTRVEAVKPYYARFMETLPDIRVLAECPPDLYNKLWEGLGYYSRVRNLNAAAVQIMEAYGGQMPDTYEELLKLKGIGSYTAGAIASNAFGIRRPAVDGNVMRILMRLMGTEWDIAKGETKKELEGLLGIWMNTCREGLPFSLKREEKPGPGVLNQAMMELGATVCLPNGQPHCSECPWRSACVSRAEETWDALPVKTKAKDRRIEKKTVFILRNQDGVYFHKREEKGLLAGLYELPNVEGWVSKKEALALLEEKGYAPIRIKKLDPAKHIFSHIEWQMQGYEVLVENPIEQKDESEWFYVDVETARRDYAIPSAFKAYAQLL